MAACHWEFNPVNVPTRSSESIPSPASEPKEYFRMRLVRLLPAACAVFLLFSSGAADAAPVRSAYSAISGAMAPLWTTQEGGYLRREGLDVELPYIGGGTLLIQAML